MRGGQMVSTFCHFGKSLISSTGFPKRTSDNPNSLFCPRCLHLASLMLACLQPALHAIRLCFVDCKFPEVDRDSVSYLCIFSPPPGPSRFIKCLSMIKVDSHVGLTCEASGSFLTLVT